MRVIILAAGMGSRLGNPFPKPLTLVSNGCSILQNQVKNIVRYINIDDILIVVGFKKELIMEAFPDLTFVYNDYFDCTNTAKSLLKGLRKTKDEDVLWLNGDVVFDHKIIGRLLRQKHSCAAVNSAKVGEEEIKYLLTGEGTIKGLSKEVENGLGEAVGINLIKKADLELFRSCLQRCEDSDYFEKGLEFAIGEGLKLYPLDISDLDCVEVDFIEDLEKANDFFARKVS